MRRRCRGKSGRVEHRRVLFSVAAVMAGDDDRTGVLSRCSDGVQNARRSTGAAPAPASRRRAAQGRTTRRCYRVGSGGSAVATWSRCATLERSSTLPASDSRPICALGDGRRLESGGCSMNELPPGMAEDEELFSRRTLTQILAVVIASSMFVLALYLVGVIGNAREEQATTATPTPPPAPEVAQMPPTVPPDDPSSSTAAPSTDEAGDSSSATTTGDGAEATTPATGGSRSDPTVTPTEPPAAAPSVVGVSASEVRADSTDSCGAPTSYEPTFAVDSIRETAWMVPGDGVGAALTIELAGPSTVSEVGLVPGYDKLDPCTGTDRFEELRRVTQVRWAFDDGTSIVQAVSPTRSLQVLRFAEPVVTSRITMTIVSTTEPGVDRLDHTPISEVVVA